ncbi:MAG: hypothetical protein HOM89_14215 [Ilumatobacter sp.]|uniref:hypothetical protein n=1 Tax=Ilumatobacter sp. TaxID=1967498 RepID=UPI001D654DDB|nr:hypothetical protein [Ilumatobacter sp.]
MWKRPTSDQVDPDPVEITMFVTSFEAPAPAPVPEPNPDVEGDEHTALAADPVLLRRQGTGTWPNGERAVRLGHAEEILITLPSNPFRAMDVARTGRPFVPPIRGLRVALDSRRDGDFEVSWNGALRAPIRWRNVSLRLYASPSLNVTVLTIVPDKARRISSRSFVRVGLRVARELAGQIEGQLATSS